MTGSSVQSRVPDTDPETWYMWADGSGGAGPRRVVTATDMGDRSTPCHPRSATCPTRSLQSGRKLTTVWAS